MQCCSALSTDNDSLRAAAVVARQARDGLSGPPHLAVLFASSQHLPRLGEIVETLRQWLDGALVVGCSGETIVGGGREIPRQRFVVGEQRRNFRPKGRARGARERGEIDQ